MIRSKGEALKDKQGASFKKTSIEIPVMLLKHSHLTKTWNMHHSVLQSHSRRVFAQSHITLRGLPCGFQSNVIGFKPVVNWNLLTMGLCFPAAKPEELKTKRKIGGTELTCSEVCSTYQACSMITISFKHARVATSESPADHLERISGLFISTLPRCLH